MYSKKDIIRLLEEKNTSSSTLYRTPFRIDYSRLVHSPSFRRLQGKTQLFPSKENDFFRNRLTHSIEVAQIAKSIALKLNVKYKRRKSNIINIDYDLVEFAALAHDLGHPPFGHQGEEALDELMIDYGGFEGNAQTLRLLTRIEKKIIVPDNTKEDQRVGLNLTTRAIASILKYDNIIPSDKVGREDYANKNSVEIEPVKGYYQSEHKIVEFVKRNVLNGYQIEVGSFKTLECHIMDIADDIAYSTYDLEDSLKAKFCNPFDMAFADKKLLEKIARIVEKKLGKKFTIKDVSDILFELFKNQFPDTKKYNSQIGSISEFFRFGTALAYQNSIKLASDGYLRTHFTSNLVDNFVEGVEFIENKKNIALSQVTLKEEIRTAVEVLKRFNYEVNIMSPRLKIAAFRGKDIIGKIFEVLTSKNGYLLMPDDYRVLYESQIENVSERNRVVCDFISGMTDSYCIEFYARLTSEDPETIFKTY